MHIFLTSLSILVAGLSIFIVIKRTSSQSSRFYNFTKDLWNHNLKWFLGFDDNFTHLHHKMDMWKEKSSFFWHEDGKWIHSNTPPPESGVYLVAIPNSSIMKYRYFKITEHRWYERENKQNASLVAENEEFLYCKVFSFK